ncbi:hypothetical protein MELA_02682 [Candidatus Methylomirabilis lanthanidiphila]|uniref:Uncharacterized protein n=1 Tax=Candidatus Methylomirabilis lanthanidiphila TaxID=2211376 RepID=A0A564ZNP7_9BACT|nr:hypothetical protein [Candidatus Methylomirabilis lanthanidiphila]VUZ86282.1 hypothetical protein MELA_02682 [Candidatus Methylomirabilis lanthanidiphila]
MLDFLNQNSGALTEVFSAAVALSTVVYAALTSKLVAETRKMRQAQTEPNVEVVVRPREEWINHVHVYVRNIGLGPAYEITFNTQVERGGKGAHTLIDDFTKAHFFKTGLSYLGPGQEVTSNLSQMTERFDEKIQSVLIFDVMYRSATHQAFQKRFRIDFSEFKGRTQIGRPLLYAIAQHLEKIQQDFHHLTTGFKRIKADTYNREDRQQEEQEWEERHASLVAEIKKAEGSDSQRGDDDLPSTSLNKVDTRT